MSDTKITDLMGWAGTSTLTMPVEEFWALVAYALEQKIMGGYSGDRNVYVATISISSEDREVSIEFEIAEPPGE